MRQRNPTHTKRWLARNPRRLRLENSWSQDELTDAANVHQALTVGRDEETIRAYIQNQGLADRQLEQLELKISAVQKSIQSS